MQLRPVQAGRGLSVDTSFGLWRDEEDRRGRTEVWALAAGHPLGGGFVLQGGFAVALNHPPSGPATTTWGNLLIAVSYHAQPRPDVSVTPIAGGLLPIARGGGNHPSEAVQAANDAATLTRSAYNGGLFAPNEAGVGAGLDAAWVVGGLTFQGEVIVADLIRVRGEQVQPDEHSPFGSAALFVGGWLRPWLSAGAEVRFIGLFFAPETIDEEPLPREQASWEVGLRAHVPLSGSVAIHPGLSYARGLDAPMTSLGFQVFTLSLVLSVQ
jgi:hypothetical protein